METLGIKVSGSENFVKEHWLKKVASTGCYVGCREGRKEGKETLHINFGHQKNYKCFAAAQHEMNKMEKCVAWFLSEIYTIINF